MSGRDQTYFTYKTAHGTMTIAATSRGVTEVAFSTVVFEGSNAPSALTNRAASQIQEYLAGKRTAFDVPLDLRGSTFQQEVWTAVADIPYGETCTPSDVAASIGKPGSHRSVGTAIKQNRLAPLIPTHRVLAPNATGQQARIFRGFQKLERKAVDAGGLS